MKMKEYLPMGTIVVLKDGTKKIMIYGRKQVLASTGETYDYVACLYPEGNINPKYTYLFNENDIEKVVFRGFDDDDNKDFVKYVLNQIDALEEGQSIGFFGIDLGKRTSNV